jgi:CRISPR-associated DxTHG motif protein
MTTRRPALAGLLHHVVSLSLTHSIASMPLLATSAR